MRLFKIVSAAMLLALAFWPGLVAGQKRKQKVVIEEPPTASLTATPSRVLLASEGRENQPEPACAATSPLVQLSAIATVDKDLPVYKFKTTGGKIESDGPNATLDLNGAAPGTYTVTVEVVYKDLTLFTSTPITVERCNYDPLPDPPCPKINVSCPSEPVKPGAPITFTANVSGGDKDAAATFNWTVSAGTISSGQGTPTITVDTTGRPNVSQWTATVDVGGYDRSCSTSSSCTASLGCVLSPARKIDEYGNIRFSDEKARLDNFTVELQNDPTSEGYIICYGGRVGYEGEAQRRCDRAKEYVANSRRIEADRLVTVDGGYKEELTVELYIVPAGVNPPTASPTVDPSEVKHKPSRRRFQ